MAFESTLLQTIRIVCATDERTATDAMRLAHDGGVEGGFLTPSPTGMRFSPTFLNPGTEFIVAYAADTPIAALALIEDGPFGLPSDRAFVEELDGFRAKGDSLFEAGAWVITRQWRRHTMHLFGMLFGTAMRLNLSTPVARRMIGVVEPRRAEALSAIVSRESTTGPRPYMMIPGTLIVTLQSDQWADHLLSPRASARCRMLAERIFSPDPAWLEVGRSGPHWTDRLLHVLLEDSTVKDRLTSQLQLLRGIRRDGVPAPSHDELEHQLGS